MLFDLYVCRVFYWFHKIIHWQVKSIGKAIVCCINIIILKYKYPWLSILLLLSLISYFLANIRMSFSFNFPILSPTTLFLSIHPYTAALCFSISSSLTVIQCTQRLFSTFPSSYSQLSVWYALEQNCKKFSLLNVRAVKK